MCCPQIRRETTPLKRLGNRDPYVIQSNGIKFCNKCGKQLHMTVVSTEGARKFWQVTPCECGA
jgi:hypothetical protein